MNREAKKTAQRQKMMDAALRLFTEQGYEETTVQQIVEQVGVSKGTFFNYFKTKEDVLYELQGQDIYAQLEQMLERPGPVAPRLVACLSDMLQRMSFTRSLVRGMLVGTLRNPLYNSCSDRQDPMIQALTPVFLQGQENGEFTRRYPPLMLAQLFVQQYYAALLSWGLGKGDEHLLSQFMLTMEVFLQGVRYEA